MMTLRLWNLLGLAALVCWLGTDFASAQTQGNWGTRSKTFRTKYYNVRTDLPADEAKAFAQHMDNTCDAYIAMFKGLTNWRQSRLDLWLFQDEADYHQTLQAQFGADGRNSKGMCVSRGNQITLAGWRGTSDDDRMRAVLQHEGFHQFARLLFRDLPTWANEGLAEVFERGVAVDGKIVIGEISKEDKRRLDAALQDGFKPFNELFTIQSSQWSADLLTGSGGINYLQAWSITHFFLWAEEGKYQKPFLKFLKLLNQQAEWRPAWVAAFGQPNFDAMEQKWRQYITEVARHDYEETIRRMDFLAQGMKALRENDIRPSTLEELKQELQKAEFKHTSPLFGESKDLSAADAEAFEIPYASEWGGECQFDLVDSRGRKPRPGARPSSIPLRIVTTGLKPVNFSVHWTRKGRDYVPSFHVE